MNFQDRVQAHTRRCINERIAAETEERVRQAASEGTPALSTRIEELENEWSIERWLEMNASALAFSGVLLGLLVNKKFFAIPCLVLLFLFQHAVQGWCPPMPVLRRNGVRTRREIDAEKFALKALRGDFGEGQSSSATPDEKARQAWQAVNA